MDSDFDVIVIGGGIAGFGVAASLGDGVRTLLLEKEQFPGVHATGRSAAVFSETYGSEPIRALSRASKPFLVSPPAEFALEPPLRPRGFLYVATADQAERLHAVASSPLMRAAADIVSAAEAMRLCPMLSPGYTATALWEPGASDIDVDALLSSYVRRFRDTGGTVKTDAEVTALVRSADRWRVTANGVEYAAAVVVNAAGAWADELAQLAGLSPLGIQPFQRTAILVDPPEGMAITAWPTVIDIDENFYFKPDAGKLLLSPADEEPVRPGDAQPEELAVAIAVDRVEQATTLRVRRVDHRWAGLRSFAPDRLPVVGFDPRAPGFFWLAGQGGYGVQTAPALSRLAAAMIAGNTAPADIVEAGLDPALLLPDRLLHRVVPAAIDAAG